MGLCISQACVVCACVCVLCISLSLFLFFFLSILMDIMYATSSTPGHVCLAEPTRGGWLVPPSTCLPSYLSDPVRSGPMLADGLAFLVTCCLLFIYLFYWLFLSLLFLSLMTGMNGLYPTLKYFTPFPVCLLPSSLYHCCPLWITNILEFHTILPPRDSSDCSIYLYLHLRLDKFGELVISQREEEEDENAKYGLMENIRTNKAQWGVKEGGRFHKKEKQLRVLFRRCAPHVWSAFQFSVFSCRSITLGNTYILWSHPVWQIFFVTLCSFFQSFRSKSVSVPFFSLFTCLIAGKCVWPVTLWWVVTVLVVVYWWEPVVVIKPRVVVVPLPCWCFSPDSTGQKILSSPFVVSDWACLACITVLPIFDLLLSQV